ncbi:hypothetical protein B9G55_02565 [Saccharibacillus sp. O16]|nr:hypothetical protein B9G55_02565 [Saccharibacillus sp. O16]
MNLKRRKKIKQKKIRRLLLGMMSASLASGLLVLHTDVRHAAAAESDAYSTDLPLRTLIENLQGQVNWQAAEGRVTFAASGMSGSFQLGRTALTLNGRTQKMDAAPVVRDGRVHLSPAAQQLLMNATAAAQNHTGFKLVSSFAMPSGKAEIASSTPDGQRLIVTEADEGSISVLDISDVAKPFLLKTVSFKSLSAAAEVTSVTAAPDGRYALAVIRTGDHKLAANPGILAVVDLDTYQIAKTYPLGIGPDSIAISPDGRYAVIAIEDEELDPKTEEFDYPNAKRPGSIAVMTFTGSDALKGELTDLPVDLSGVKGAIYPHEPQPEYVAINEAGTMAAVTLQENNVIALVDLPTRKITKMFALGTTQHAADVKEDGKAAFTDKLTARFEPDGIAFSPDGQYLITANEGDLGKNEFDDGVRPGGRNIAVWDLDGRRIHDSMNWIDEAAARAGIYPDDRSPNKGSEVENLTVSTVGGQSLLAVAAERADAILFFDVKDAAKPAYLGLIQTAGESPEGIHRVHGRNLFVSADEGTGTISFYGPDLAGR